MIMAGKPPKRSNRRRNERFIIRSRLEYEAINASAVAEWSVFDLPRNTDQKNQVKMVANSNYFFAFNYSNVVFKGRLF